jgi:hypothetical protein
MKDIALTNVSEVVNFSPEYNNMVEHINKCMPAISRDTENFYKSSSQFKNVTLDITDLTPTSSIRHCLAVIDQTKQALEKAHIELRKNDIKLKKKQQEFSNSVDEYEKELLDVEITEIITTSENIKNSVKGAVRKLSFFVTQYKALMEKIGKTELTELDIEEEENKYHIMTAMKQALIAARARGGIIDEGNHIYLFDMGINGAVAQKEISNYLAIEQDIINQGLEPAHIMTIKWLEACAEKFQNCGTIFAANRGFIPLDNQSLLKGITI